jgi:hypothetical protein
VRRLTLILLAALAAPVVASARPAPVSSYDTVLAALDDVCVPALRGTDPAKTAAADGFAPGDGGWSLRGDDFAVIVEAPHAGAPCLVDVTHPYDDVAPGRGIVLTLNDWANAHRGWVIDRNDRTVDGDVEVTTRSWRGAHGASLLFVTRRHADGTPMQDDADTSQLLYRPSQ